MDSDQNRWGSVKSSASVAPNNSITLLLLQMQDDGAIFFIFLFFSSINSLSPLQASAHRV